MGGNELGKDQKMAKPETVERKGSAPCGGALRKRFEQAKDNPKMQGAIAILCDTVRNGSAEEKEVAKTTLITKLNESGDYVCAVKEIIETGDGNPAIRGLLTHHFSQLLKSEDGLRRIDSLARIEDENVLKEFVKSIADTRDPTALDFIIRASRRCSHPVGAWQAPKVADAGNIERVAEFIQSEAAKQSNGLREKILESAKRELSAKGLETFILDQRDSVQSHRVQDQVAQPGNRAVAEEMTHADDNRYQPVRPDQSMSEFSGAESGALIPKHMKTEPDLSLFVQTMETFFKVHGFSSSVLDPVKLFFTPYIDEKNQVKDSGNRDGDEKGNGVDRPSFRVKLVPAEKKKTNGVFTEHDGGAGNMQPLAQGHGPFKDKVRQFKKTIFDVGSPEVQEVIAISSKKNKKKRAKKEAWETSRRLDFSGRMQKKRAEPKSQNVKIIQKEKIEIRPQRNEKEKGIKENTKSKKHPALKKAIDVHLPQTNQRGQKIKQGVKRREPEMQKKSKTRRQVGTKTGAEEEIRKNELRLRTGSTLASRTKNTKPAKTKKTNETRERSIAEKRAARKSDTKIQKGKDRKTKSKRDVMMLLMENRKKKPRRR